MIDICRRSFNFEVEDRTRYRNYDPYTKLAGNEGEVQLLIFS